MVKLNPKVITDDMMYEGVDLSESFVPTAEIDAWAIDYQEHIKEDRLWEEIRRAAKTNKTLQHALEECIIIYKLSKEYKNGI